MMSPNWKSLLPAVCLAALLGARLFAQSVDPPQKLHLSLPGPMSPALNSQGNERQPLSRKMPASEPGLTLERLQQMALANNPTLGQAKAGVQAAAGRTRQAGLWPNPTVGYTSEEIRGGSFGGGQHGVFVQQDIILGGKLGLSRKVFEQEGKQAEAEQGEQRLRVMNGVRIAFYQSLAAQQMVEVRGKLSELAKDALQTTQQLFNVGQADEPDVLQAHVEADQAELAVVAAEQDQVRAWSVLAATVGKPDLPPTRLEGGLENLPEIDSAQMLETILQQSPAVKISQLGVARAEADLARAHREVVPDLTLRAGYLNNLEQLGTLPPKAVGSEGLAEAGIRLRIFNRNQGNIEASKADLERSRLEVDRVSLVLRQRAAPLLQSYVTSRTMAERYRTQTIPHAQKAYELYLHKYREGGAAYPQVLIAQRTLFQLQAGYIAILEKAWINATTLQGLLLTDGLDQPASPGEIERPVREINLPTPEVPGTAP